MSAHRSGTVGKALAILTLLGEHPDGATAAQIAAATEHPFSTAYRLLNTLVDSGYADYDPQDKRFRVGLRVYQLAQRTAQHRGFEGTAGPILQRLTEATGQSSVLHVLDGHRALTIHKVDGPQFRITTDPGDHSPLHTTAAGKVLLAFAEPSQRERLLGELELPARTEHSVTDRAELGRQIERIRAQGWAAQSQENDVGMAAIATPVLSQGGLLIGAVNLSAPTSLIELRELHLLLPRLQEAAHELGLRLPARP